MKTLIIALLLTTATVQAGEPSPKVDDKFMAQELGPFQYVFLTNAIAKATNKDDVLPRLERALSSNAVNWLAEQPMRTLKGYKRSIERKTNRLQYTSEQIDEAIRLKESGKRHPSGIPLRFSLMECE